MEELKLHLTALISEENEISDDEKSLQTLWGSISSEKDDAVTTILLAEVLLSFEYTWCMKRTDNTHISYRCARVGSWKFLKKLSKQWLAL